MRSKNKTLGNAWCNSGNDSVSIPVYFFVTWKLSARSPCRGKDELILVEGSLYDNDANNVLISHISRCKLTLNATVNLRLRWRQSSISDLEFGLVGSPSQIEDHFLLQALAIKNLP